MDIKILSYGHACWDQEIFRYHFRINYSQGEANEAANFRSWFIQRRQEEEKEVTSQILESLLTIVFTKNCQFFGPSYFEHVSTLIMSRILLQQVLICEKHVFPQLRYFWIRSEPNRPINVLIKHAFGAWNWDCRSCRRISYKPENQEKDT